MRSRALTLAVADWEARYSLHGCHNRPFPSLRLRRCLRWRPSSLPAISRSVQLADRLLERGDSFEVNLFESRAAWLLGVIPLAGDLPSSSPSLARRTRWGAMACACTCG